MVFSSILENEIKKKGVSRKKFAKYIGVHDSTVSWWTTGRCLPNSKHLSKICTYFNKDKDYMLGKLSIGDRVQFKSWEEMKKQFGQHDCCGTSYLNTERPFTSFMRPLCGTYATICVFGILT